MAHPDRSHPSPPDPGEAAIGGGADRSWRSLWLSSGAMSIGQLGDSLIYIVLPVSALEFGIDLIWVGILLSANRIIRTFTYGWIAQLAARLGLRKLCLIAAGTALISTAGYGALSGGWLLLGARCVWGLSYAALLLVALGYAATDRSRTGTRVGMSRAIEQVGPLIALTVGAWLAGAFGPREAFYWMALGTTAALVMALALPRAEFTPPATRQRSAVLPKPERLDALIFWMGGGADGVFMMTVTLMLSRYVPVTEAMLWGGLVVSLRRIAEMLFAPISGMIADHFGFRRPLLISSGLLIGGFAAIGFGWLIPGAIAMVIARGALGTLLPTAVAHLAPHDVLNALARNATWRDIGAAAGPLLTGLLLTSFTPEQLHMGLAIGYAMSLLWVVRWSEWRKVD